MRARKACRAIGLLRLRGRAGCRAIANATIRAFGIGVRSLGNIAAYSIAAAAFLGRRTGRTRVHANVIAAEPVHAIVRQALCRGRASEAIVVLAHVLAVARTVRAIIVRVRVVLDRPANAVEALAFLGRATRHALVVAFAVATETIDTIAARALRIRRARYRIRWWSQSQRLFDAIVCLSYRVIGCSLGGIVSSEAAESTAAPFAIRFAGYPRATACCRHQADGDAYSAGKPYQFATTACIHTDLLLVNSRRRKCWIHERFLLRCSEPLEHSIYVRGTEICKHHAFPRETVSPRPAPLAATPPRIERQLRVDDHHARERRFQGSLPSPAVIQAPTCPEKLWPKGTSCVSLFVLR